MKKIMFNKHYGLEQAVLEGWKTMTRRIAYDGKMRYEPHFGFNKKGQMVLLDGWKVVATSRYAIGEEVAIAQSYEDLANSRYCIELGMMDSPTTFKKEFCGKGWGNKMFVKADLMPNRIKMTNIRAERIQSASESDILREGISFDPIRSFPNPYHKWCFWDKELNRYREFKTAIEAFEKLIKWTGRKRDWDDNPWVFVYEFELIK